MDFSDNKLFEFPSPYVRSKTMVGFFKFEKYWYNKNLCIQMFAKEKDSREDYFEPYCTVSVNLIKANPQTSNCIFVDVEHAPWLEEFLSDKGFGLPTGRYVTQGYCTFPEYLLNLKTMKRYAMAEVAL